MKIIFKFKRILSAALLLCLIILTVTVSVSCSANEEVTDTISSQDMIEQEDFRNLPTGNRNWDDGKYYGALYRGVPHGQGTLEWQNLKYEGAFSYGVRDGRGILEWNNRDVYDGEFQNGLKHGRGTMTWYNDGRWYEGGWANDMRNGTGTLHWESGERIEGIWNNDNLSEGRMFFSDDCAGYPVIEENGEFVIVDW